MAPVISMDIKIINSILPPILFIFVFGIFAYVYLKSRSLLDIEKDLEPRFKSNCTSYLDGLKNVCTRFAIYDEFIVVSSRKKIALKFNEISSVNQGRVWGCKSLDIRHHRTNTPQISLLLKDIETPKNLINSKLDAKSL